MKRNLSMKRTNLLISAIIFTATFVVYSISSITPRADSMWSVYLAESFVRTGNFNLDEYRSLIKPDDYRVVEVNGHLYSFFPIGAPLMASPFVYAIDHFTSLRLFGGENLSTYLLNHSPDDVVSFVEKFIASILVALNCVIIFILSRRYLNIAKSIILTLIFAFATSNWSVSSRALWQHGPSMLCLSLAVYILIVAQDKPSLVPLAGFPLAFSFVVRPTNIISIGLLTIYVWFAFRRFWGYYILCLAVILVPFFLYNYSVYSALVSPYYAPQRLGNNPFLAQALAGNLMSPSRGLFIFSPILACSILGFYRTFRKFKLVLCHTWIDG